FGGYGNVLNNGSYYLNDTWTFNGSKWTQQHPATAPSARDDAAMAFDVVHGNTVLFGGRDSVSNYLADTWLWSGSTWVQQSPANAPPTRWNSMMSYDSILSTTVLFGGSCSNAPGCPGIPLVTFNDTWYWSGSNWSQQTPPNSPPARALASMTYDDSTQTLVLF